MVVQINGLRTGQVGVNQLYGSQSFNFSAIQGAALLALSQQLMDPRNQLLARLFANLPPAPLPRPPAYSVGLPQAAYNFGNFASKINEFADRTGVGLNQAQDVRAASDLVGQAVAQQERAANISVTVSVSSSIHVGTDPTLGSAPNLRKTTDEFGTGLGAGKGHTSNLANSPEVVLALNSILKNKGLMKMEEVQKQLKEKYGIEAEVTKIDGRKALKFANGDYIVDANGNGGLDRKDYHFKEAVSSIQQKYGMTEDQVKNLNSASLQQIAGVSGPASATIDYQQYAAFFVQAYQRAA